MNSRPLLSDNEIMTFGIIGLGYVGLPLCVEAAESGAFKVIGFDVNKQVVESVNSGCSHIQDLTDDQVGSLRKRGLIEATCDMSRLAECDAISICVPTPLSKTRDPDVSYISAASDAVAATLCPGQLIVLESTTYPGTTREVLKPKLESTGLVAGEDFHLCFSPERVDPGNKTWTTRNTPKVIGGLTEACGDVGQSFYEQFIDKLVEGLDLRAFFFHADIGGGPIAESGADISFGLEHPCRIAIWHQTTGVRQSVQPVAGGTLSSLVVVECYQHHWGSRQ
ncbi:MAG TPA: hypothetical protein EYQ39_07620 [Gemmatimonadetes bacterium]|nr:hypothetical protein [Gemmatimonadota bacterium]